jgi:protoporphyrinogen oxidase
MENGKRDVIVFGAGPAGLAAALELARKGKSVLLTEKERQVGGISKTIEYKGCRFDLGGHRFFTKSKEVNDLWNETLGADFLTRPRSSRIYYKNKFFGYPLKPVNALMGLGLFTSLSVLASYLYVKLFPYKEEKTFEEWVSNRFGRRLYKIFFKTYTEKLWGIPCTEIRAEWAAQRIKGLSLRSLIKNALFPDRTGKIKTLIEEFKYPRFGPGMMYEKMAENVQKAGGGLLMETEVIKIKHEGNVAKSVLLKDGSGERELSAGHFISSMPITELVKRLDPPAPESVLKAAHALKYRSFLTVNVILKCPNPFPDTWIYIHSPEIKMGRIQNFKNWSPEMVRDPRQTALGLEYFCTEGDPLWNTSDSVLMELGLRELEELKLGLASDFEEGFVARIPKAYPVYEARYPENIRIIREYLTNFKNLQPVGRYGMFKYNNMDHSILTGLYAARNIMGANYDIWEVNTDQEYHEEEKKAPVKIE